jgi:FkbM family methyltransferase
MEISQLGYSWTVIDFDLPFWRLVQAGGWEPNTFEVFKRFLDKEHSYVDIGAWIGPTVLFGCQLAKHCYAIEPDPVAFPVLRENVKVNGFTNVSLFSVAISNENGTMKLASTHKLGDSLTSYLHHQGDVVEAPCLFLEKFFKDYKVVDCNFIKIDVEGAEWMILESSVDFLKSFKPALFVSLHPHLFLNKIAYINSVVDSLNKAGYDRTLFDKIGRNKFDIILPGGK